MYKHVKNWLVQFVKLILLIFPGAVLGYYIDSVIRQLQQSHDGPPILYVLIQLLVIAVVLYAMTVLAKTYISEITNTIIGSAFVALFFGMQKNLYFNIKQILSVDSS